MKEREQILLSHFTGQHMEAQRGEHLPEIAQLVSGRPGSMCQFSCSLVSIAHNCSETLHPPSSLDSLSGLVQQ